MDFEPDDCPCACGGCPPEEPEEPGEPEDGDGQPSTLSSALDLEEGRLPADEVFGCAPVPEAVPAGVENFQLWLHNGSLEGA